MAKQMFVTMTQQEVNDFLSQSGLQPYKLIGHQFSPMNGIGKQVCKSCGLVALNNKATEWCINKGCRYESHQSYQSAMKRLTKQKWG